MRTDILRGIRAGAILLAVLFAAVAAYRIVRVSPPANPPALSIESTPAPEPPVAAAPVEAPANSADVPPPPPSSKIASHRSGRRAAAPSGTTEKIILVDPSLAVDENIVAIPEVAAPVVEKEEKPLPSQPAARQVDARVSQPEQVAGDDSAPRADGHAKRLVKAVRRLLHLPKKDTSPETLKQF